jgi:hypothetical protein
MLEFIRKSGRQTHIWIKVKGKGMKLPQPGREGILKVNGCVVPLILNLDTRWW